VHIEEQRWMPLAPNCADIDAAGYPTGEGVGLAKHFSTTEHLPINVSDAGYACFVRKSCTEFAPYSEAHDYGGPSLVAKTPDTAFGGQGARVISVNYNLADAFVYLMVPNYGAPAHSWWWSGSGGATAAQLADVLQGRAWGNFKHDNITKKIVSVVRSRVDGKFRFVLNKVEPGDAWWWGYGASIDNIKAVLNGDAWASFAKDGIEKRLVQLKRHAKGNWTFLMRPRNSLGWAWYPSIDSVSLVAEAKKNNHRVISIEPLEHANPCSAVTVQNL
jgi:hypothetical protein